MAKLLRRCLLQLNFSLPLDEARQDLRGMRFSFDKAGINDKELAVSLKANIPVRNKKYLTTSLLKEELVKEDYHSKDVQLVHYKAISSM